MKSVSQRYLHPAFRAALFTTAEICRQPVFHGGQRDVASAYKDVVFIFEKENPAE